MLRTKHIFLKNRLTYPRNKIVDFFVTQCISEQVR